MTFLYALNTGPEKVSFEELMGIYNNACSPDFTGDHTVTNEVCEGRCIGMCDGLFVSGGRCAPTTAGPGLCTGQCEAPRCDLNLRIGWRDESVPGAPDPIFTVGGFLDGAIRKFGFLSPEANLVELSGLQHGVDENTDP